MVNNCWFGYSIGRRKTFLLIWLLLAVCSTACAFATDYWTFAILRFFCGVFNIGYFLATFIWGKLYSNNAAYWKLIMTKKSFTWNKLISYHVTRIIRYNADDISSVTNEFKSNLLNTFQMKRFLELALDLWFQ